MRAFIRAPALSLALLFTIALGVGSNAAVYAFVQGLIHPDSPLPASHGIVSILEQDRTREQGPLTLGEYQQLRTNPSLFEWIDAARITPRDVTVDGHTEIATVAEVTPNLAAALNLSLPGGSLEDGQPQDGVIVSQHMWQNSLGSKADLRGKRIHVGHRDLFIAGVAPNQLRGLYSDQPVDLWLPYQEPPYQVTPSQAGNPHSVAPTARNFWVIARLRPPASITQAQAAVRQQFGNSDAVSVTSFTGAAPTMALGLSRIGTLLNFASAAVFFVASINVASFLFGRALKRSHETSLRIALGETRAQLLGELLSDSIVISVAGGALGALLAAGTAHILPALLFAEDAERLIFATHALATFTASIFPVGLTILCGMLPVFATDTDRPWIVLGRESGLPSQRTERIRTALVLSQVTSCYVLVICAVFLFEGLHTALKQTAGHQLGHPIVVTVEERLVQPEVDINYFKQVEHAAKSIPGLTARAWAARLPGDRPIWRSFRIQPASAPLHDLKMDVVWLANDALGPLNERLIAGRGFGLSKPGQRDAVIDEDAAQKLSGPETVGMMIEDSSGLPVEILGVVSRSSTTPASNHRRGTIYYATDPSHVPRPMQGVVFRAPQAASTNSAELSQNVVSPSYFKALDLSVEAGRLFVEQPMLGQVRVGVVNQEAADLYFSGKPVGAGIIDDEGIRTEIAGVVEARTPGTFQKHPEPAIYFPMQQDCAQRMTLILDGQIMDTHALTLLRRKLESVPGGTTTPIAIETLDEHLARSAFAALRIAALLSSALALLALLLSVLGLLSAQSDAERQRRRELALRIALGAPRWRIVLSVIAAAVRIALAGTAIGAVVSLALFRVLGSENDIFTSPPIWVWLMVALLPTATVLIASVLPAIRASHANPLTIMRDQH